MKLVVDANILIASLLKDAATRELILREDFDFFAPEQLLKEIKNLIKNPKIRKRFKLSDENLYELTSAILSRINFIPEKLFINSANQALSLVTHTDELLVDFIK